MCVCVGGGGGWGGGVVAQGNEPCCLWLSLQSNVIGCFGH